MLETGSPEAVEQALERFSRMPETAQKAIYEKLYKVICKPFAMDLGRGEDAYNRDWQSSTSDQKAQAIRSYLKDQPPEKY